MHLHPPLTAAAQQQQQQQAPAPPLTMTEKLKEMEAAANPLIAKHKEVMTLLAQDPPPEEPILHRFDELIDMEKTYVSVYIEYNKVHACDRWFVDMLRVIGRSWGMLPLPMSAAKRRRLGRW